MNQNSQWLQKILIQIQSLSLSVALESGRYVTISRSNQNRETNHLTKRLMFQFLLQVMKNQEAINLIRHIEDPQDAAKCLAKEALNRISKSDISCLVIRFD